MRSWWRRPPRATQSVTASGGSAFGSDSGHVTLSGPIAAIYFLVNAPWPALAEPPPAVLRSWLEESEPMAVHWLHGADPSSAALGVQAYAARAGWQLCNAVPAGELTAAPGTPMTSAPARDADFLTVVHTADRWRLEDLTWLLSNAVFHHRPARARVLLAGTGLDTWPALRGALGATSWQVSDSPVPGADRRNR